LTPPPSRVHRVSKRAVNDPIPIVNFQWIIFWSTMMLMNIPMSFGEIILIHQHGGGSQPDKEIENRCLALARISGSKMQIMLPHQR
jgi:hypothetical protein